MKFTKDDAYKALVGKMTAKGEKLNLSERSINEQLETLIALVASEETELNDFIEKVAPVFATADANVRNDVSAGIKKYKEDNPLPTPPKKDEKKEDKVEEPKDEKYEALLKRLEAMEEAHKADETKKKVKALKDDFIAKAKEKGVKNESWLNDYADEITIGEDFDVETKAESCLKFYNKFKSKMNADISPDDAGGDKGDAAKYLKDVIKAAGEKAKSESI